MPPRASRRAPGARPPEPPPPPPPPEPKPSGVCDGIGCLRLAEFAAVLVLPPPRRFEPAEPIRAEFGLALCAFHTAAAERDGPETFLGGREVLVDLVERIVAVAAGEGRVVVPPDPERARVETRRL